ncbi:MAG TPA: hypothetical protein VG757_07635 [Devosia sp.]|nr:hypothetical protein [Devosia sp.]
MSKLSLLMSMAVLLVAAPALAQDMSRSSSMDMSVSEESSSGIVSSEEMSSEVSSEDISDETSDPDLYKEAVPALEVLQAIFDVCTDVASGDPEAVDRAAGAGWQPGDAEEGGPYRIINSGFRSFAGYDDANFRAVTDIFPTQRLGYCSGSLGDRNDKVNLADFGQIGGLKGTTTAEDGGMFGTWESADGKLMVFAGKSDGYVDYEFNILLPPAP